MGTIWTVCPAAGVLLAALLRWLPVRGRAEGLGAVRLAALRGGGKAALAVVVVEYRLAGALDADRGGRLRLRGRVDPPVEPTPCTAPCAAAWPDRWLFPTSPGGPPCSGPDANCAGTWPTVTCSAAPPGSPQHA